MVKKYAVEARRVEILEAACEVVIERGFAGTRVADVAKRLNVSNSLIHYHFDSKEALLAAAFEYYARKDLARWSATSNSDSRRLRNCGGSSRVTFPRAATTWSGCCGSTRGAKHCATRS